MTCGRRNTTSQETLVAVLLCGALALIATLTTTISYATRHREIAPLTASAPATAHTTARVAVVEAAPVLIHTGSRQGRAPVPAGAAPVAASPAPTFAALPSADATLEAQVRR
jgi:hypothetical protein